MGKNILIMILIICIYTSCKNKTENNSSGFQQDKVSIEFPENIIRGDSVKIELKYQLEFDSIDIYTIGEPESAEEMREKIFYYKDSYISEDNLFSFARDSSVKVQKKSGIRSIKLGAKNSSFFYHVFSKLGRTQFCGLFVDVAIVPDRINKDSVQMKYNTTYLRRNINVKNKG